MAKKKELTVEERLRALYDLQLIDSRVDEIRNVRGELPLEVRLSIPWQKMPAAAAHNHIDTIDISALKSRLEVAFKVN